MERERSECRPIPLLLEQLLQALRSNPNVHSIALGAGA